MDDLTIQQIHDRCLGTTQQAIEGFGWDNISVGVLSEADKERLEEGIDHSILNWPWAMNRYRGNADDGILDISLKVIDHDDPGSLHAVIICKYDERREQFSICMLENFISDEETALTGNVLIIALIYSTTFCNIIEFEEIFIQDPTPDAKPRYRSYGFAQVWNDHDKMSAEVRDILEMIRIKVNGVDLDE
ncbi:hypothetical protein [Acerihabitans arboris]|uniref:Uncharacterized protein n=1 Tax=Acerihabitans arboris TaxID=2691583 RepID=A0A845SQ76_9GAMM|nr:hypothetical protein [Acerihabitans arboris]NDL65066.1 hypothetical protein [Acerihabitans arboris]